MPPQLPLPNQLIHPLHRSGHLLYTPRHLSLPLVTLDPLANTRTLDRESPLERPRLLERRALA